jgi:MFS family permease
MSGARGAAHGAASATSAAARAGKSATRGTARVIHRLTGASGAGRTGLDKLIELTAAGSVGDAFVAVSLAGTIFFSTSVDQARGRVALFLLITMAPFAVLAPFIGPMLDRLQDGRRYILAGTFLARGLLCWGMSAAVKNPYTLLPSAFGILVLQKAYGVARASVAPRLLPPEITLVKANARSALAALIAASIAAPVAAGVDKLLGPGWVLRLATVIYLAAMALALRLPSHVDVPRADTEPTQPLPADPDGLARTAGRAGSQAQAGYDTEDGYDAEPGYGTGAGHRAEPGYGTGGGYDPRGGYGTGAGHRAEPGYDTEDGYGTEAGYGPQPGYEPQGGYGPQGGYDAQDGYDMGAGHDGQAGHDGRTRPLPGEPNGQSPPGNDKGRVRRTLRQVGPVVAEAMQGNAVLRALSGYMIFFLAFLLRSDHFPGVSQNVALGAMVGAAAIGGLAAMAIGSMLRSASPQVMLFSMLALATVVTAVCAWFFGLFAALIVAFVAACATAIAKLALDSTVQREIGEEIRSSAFAVSETLHQLSWVAGGLAGLAVSFTNSGSAGLAIAAAGLGVALFLLIARRRRRIRSTRPAPRPKPAPSTR